MSKKTILNILQPLRLKYPYDKIICKIVKIEKEENLCIQY